MDENKIQNTMTITIFEASDGEGYMYDIYDCEASEVDDNDSLEGGQCTSDNIKDALAMAVDQARDLLIRNKYNIK